MKVWIKNVAGLDEAMEGARLAYNSKRATDETRYSGDGHYEVWNDDYKLVHRLIKKGDSHGKVARMIQVWLDITAPRFWWAEMDTYKQGTVATSESTIHTIKKHPLSTDNFENGNVLTDTLHALNTAIKNNDELVWIKSLLPESFLQRRIVNTNYQTLRHIYFDRKNHVLPQWKIFIDALDDLPFVGLIKTDKEEL